LALRLGPDAWSEQADVSRVRRSFPNLYSFLFPPSVVHISSLFDSFFFSYLTNLARSGCGVVHGVGENQFPDLGRFFGFFGT
jgi:hypothetical protein